MDDEHEALSRQVNEAVQEVLSRFAGEHPEAGLVADVTAEAMAALVVFVWSNGGADKGVEAGAHMFGAASRTFFRQLQEQDDGGWLRPH